jgi:tripartite-type tricarboxylate transporter receptor subunit TctC
LTLHFNGDAKCWLRRPPDGFLTAPCDMLARLIGQKLNEPVDAARSDREPPGANPVIGAQIVAKMPPDGYTQLMAIDSTLVMNQFMYRTPPYAPIEDFAPVI